MNRRLFHLPENASPKMRSAFRYAGIIAMSTILVFPVYVYLLFLNNNAWQLWIAASIVIGIFVVSLISRRLIQAGHTERGAQILIYSLLIGLVANSFIIANLGIVLGLTAIALTVVIAMQTVEKPDRFIVTSFVMGAVSILLDLFLPPYRLVLPALQFITPIMITPVVLILGFMTFRRFRDFSLRNKLLAAFIGVTVLSAGALAVYMFRTTNNLLRQGLESGLTEHTDEMALRIGDVFSEQISLIKTFALNEILEESVEDSNEAYTGTTTAIQAELNAKDLQWRDADTAGNNNDPLVQEALTSQAALELREFQGAFPSHVEIFITDVYGGLVGTTNRTSDYYQADEVWWQAAYNNGQGAVYLSEPELDESAGLLAVQIASPVRSDETGEIIGILRTTYLMSSLNSILDEKVGETGVTELIIPGEVVSHFHEGEYKPVDAAEYAALQAVADPGMVEMDYEGEANVILRAPVRTLEGNSTVDNLGWVVMFHQNRNEAFTPVNAQIRGAIIVMVIVMALAVAAAIGLSLALVRPISQLTQTAEEVAAGNLNSRAKVTSSDEVGILASTFNKMTSQLQETLQGLEQRVATRTKDLQIVAEVGTATATILESKRLLQEVVDLTKERFSLYHSHIYLLDEAGKNLVLAAGAGEPGRQMLAKGLSIPLDREQSLVARAARERKGVTVNDVTQASDFLPNPLLPHTRSELAVPMLVGGSLIGVFDIQSDQVGRFTDSDVNIQTTMAAQLATSIQNVRSFEHAKIQAEFEAQVSAIGQKIQRSTSIEDTLQIAIREIGLALGAQRVSASIGAAEQGARDGARRS